MKKQLFSLRWLVLTAVFVALILVLQLTGFGLIKLGFINITFYCTVIAICTMSLGLESGMVLGIVFGAVSFWSALTSPSALVAPLMAQSWLLGLPLCFAPRLLVPVATHVLSRRIARTGREKMSLIAGGVAGSLTNTVLYLGLMLLLYAVTVASYPALLAAVGSAVLCGGLPEAVAAGIIAPPVTLALRKIKR